MATKTNCLVLVSLPRGAGDVARGLGELCGVPLTCPRLVPWLRVLRRVYPATPRIWRGPFSRN